MDNASIAICFSKDRSHVLLVRRRDVPIWVLPGGGVESGETPEQAALRELYEETAVLGSLPRHVATYLPLNRLSSKTYLIECIPDERSVPSPQIETRDVGFFPVDRLPQPFFFLHEEWIYDARSYSTPVVKPITSITWRRLIQEAMKHPVLLFRYLCSRLGLPINS